LIQITLFAEDVEIWRLCIVHCVFFSVCTFSKVNLLVQYEFWICSRLTTVNYPRIWQVKSHLLMKLINYESLDDKEGSSMYMYFLLQNIMMIVHLYW